MVTTLGEFLNCLPRNTYFVSEPEADGTRCYYPVEDLVGIPGDDPIWSNPVVAFWMDEHTALLSHPEKADPVCKLIVSKFRVFVQKPVMRSVYLFPVTQCNAIMTMAEMLAVLNESWKQDFCTDAQELLREGMEYAQLDFDRPQLKGVYWTDDEPQYVSIFAAAYVRAYRQCVATRRGKAE